MDWLLQHWQSAAALGVVGLTLGIFTRHLLRPRNPGCGGKCDCPATELKKRP